MLKHLRSRAESNSSRFCLNNLWIGGNLRPSNRRMSCCPAAVGRHRDDVGGGGRTAANLIQEVDRRPQYVGGGQEAAVVSLEMPPNALGDEKLVFPAEQRSCADFFQISSEDIQFPLFILSFCYCQCLAAFVSKAQCFGKSSYSCGQKKTKVRRHREIAIIRINEWSSASLIGEPSNDNSCEPGGQDKS